MGFVNNRRNEQLVFAKRNQHLVKHNGDGDKLTSFKIVSSIVVVIVLGTLFLELVQTLEFKNSGQNSQRGERTIVRYEQKEEKAK